MDIKPVNQINFEYNGKRYCLEYTRETVKMMEAAGFNPGETGSKPLIEMEQLWAGAFLANHRRVSSRVIEELFNQMKDKSKLLETLRHMVADTYESIMGYNNEGEDDSGNVDWTATL